MATRVSNPEEVKKKAIEMRLRVHGSGFLAPLTIAGQSPTEDHIKITW